MPGRVRAVRVAPPSVLVDGCAYGSTSMRAYALGTDPAAADRAGGAAPMSTEAPADAANT